MYILNEFYNLSNLDSFFLFTSVSNIKKRNGKIQGKNELQSPRWT